MTDANATEPEEGRPSQAEGEDPAHPGESEVLPATGEPSQAEGEDPDHEDPHEVLQP